MMSQRAGMTWTSSHVQIRLLLNMEYHVRCQCRILEYE
jgi:hypothetical protein